MQRRNEISFALDDIAMEVLEEQERSSDEGSINDTIRWLWNGLQCPEGAKAGRDATGGAQRASLAKMYWRLPVHILHSDL
ncbi:MAG: hypothetical protein ABJN40_07345 [Sneathiella sp.]